MKIEIETDIYNERRYGKPWIAKVEFHLDITRVNSAVFAEPRRIRALIKLLDRAQ